MVQGNRQLLAQLITNLIENGLKYVPAGGRIEVARAAAGEHVRLVVSDDGPGIDAADRARAGQPFVRFGPGRQEGSGLGLVWWRRSRGCTAGGSSSRTTTRACGWWSICR